jgi:hypothetical protein
MRIYFFQPNAESRNFHGAKQSRFPQQKEKRQEKSGRRQEKKGNFCAVKIVDIKAGWKK